MSVPAVPCNPYFQNCGGTPGTGRSEGAAPDNVVPEQAGQTDEARQADAAALEAARAQEASRHEAELEGQTGENWDCAYLGNELVCTSEVSTEEATPTPDQGQKVNVEK